MKKKKFQVGGESAEKERKGTLVIQRKINVESDKPSVMKNDEINNVNIYFKSKTL